MNTNFNEKGKHKTEKNYEYKIQLNKIKLNSKKNIKNKKATKKYENENENKNLINQFYNTKNEFNDSVTSFQKISIIFNPIDSSLNFQGNYNTYITDVIRSLPPLFKIDFSEFILQRLVLLPEYNQKKTLILDLDETLIHADFAKRYKNYDHLISFKFEEQIVSVGIFIRPGLKEFLKRLSQIFEIFIFTASKKEYADACIDIIDPEKKIFKHKLYRDSCIPINNKTYIKDLRIFVNRKQENLILVDNSFYSFSNQPKNGVLINSYYNDPNDRELYNLINYLENYLNPSEDIREINEKIFNFSSLINKCIGIYLDDN
jgi:CTD small phosphatase-like protein 2